MGCELLVAARLAEMRFEFCYARLACQAHGAALGGFGAGFGGASGYRAGILARGRGIAVAAQLGLDFG